MTLNNFQGILQLFENYSTCYIARICLLANQKACVAILTAVSKLKDFSRPLPVTCTIKWQYLGNGAR